MVLQTIALLLSYKTWSGFEALLPVPLSPKLSALLIELNPDSSLRGESNTRFRPRLTLDDSSTNRGRRPTPRRRRDMAGDERVDRSSSGLESDILPLN